MGILTINHTVGSPRIHAGDENKLATLVAVSLLVGDVSSDGLTANISCCTCEVRMSPQRWQLQQVGEFLSKEPGTSPLNSSDDFMGSNIREDAHKQVYVVWHYLHGKYAPVILLADIPNYLP